MAETRLSSTGLGPSQPADGGPHRPVLLFRARRFICAVPVTDVAEIHRPLRVEPVRGSPAFVRGVSIVRGSPVPVVSVGILLGDVGPASSTRVVSLRVGARRVELEVDEVLGVRRLSSSELTRAPPLLEGAVARHVEELGTLDGRLLATLATAQIIEDATGAIATSEGS